MSDVFDQPTIFEAWGSTQYGANCISTPENAKQLAQMDDPDAIALFSIRGTSWEEVMQAYYDIQGWGKYTPMEG